MPVCSRRRSGGRSGGFTLVELLVTLLIMAILMAIALPLCLGAVRHSGTTTCRSNMWSIAQAEQSSKINSPTHTFTTNLGDLDRDLGRTPVCPDRGSYSVVLSDGTLKANNGRNVPEGGIVIRCSDPGHGVFAPGVDSE